MKANVGLTDEARLEVGPMLNLLLAGKPAACAAPKVRYAVSGSIEQH